MEPPQGSSPNHRYGLTKPQADLEVDGFHEDKVHLGPIPGPLGDRHRRSVAIHNRSAVHGLVDVITLDARPWRR